MCKQDLKDAHLCVSLSQDDRKRVMFRWKGTLSQFLCLCFGLAPTPYVFTKLLKTPMTLLRRIGVRLVIYLDDILIIGRTREETIALRDTLILLLQCLGMVINQKKSVMTPVQEIEFLGMIVNSKEITEKTTINKRDVSGFVSDRFVTVLELTKVSAHLTSTVLAILPAKLLCRFLQQQQIQALNLLLLEKAKCY